MRRPRSGQDGFIREIIWLAVIVAVIAVVLLDAMALFNAHQSSHDSAAAAVREAETEYAQSQSVAQAKQAATQYLEKSGLTLIAFKTTTAFGGGTGFAVTTEGHAETYAFKHLQRIPGLRSWVERMLVPVSTESSE